MNYHKLRLGKQKLDLVKNLNIKIIIKFIITIREQHSKFQFDQNGESYSQIKELWKLFKYLLFLKY